MNQQFQKAFSKKAPLSLGWLAARALQNGMDDGKVGGRSVPPSLHSRCRPMPEVAMSVPGVMKLLCNLSPSRASGPDSIGPIVLGNLAMRLPCFSRCSSRGCWTRVGSLLVGPGRVSPPSSGGGMEVVPLATVPYH